MNGFENIYITHAHTHSRLQKTCIMRAHTHTHTHGSLLDLKLLGCSQITHKQTHKQARTHTCTLSLTQTHKYSFPSDPKLLGWLDDGPNAPVKIANFDIKSLNGDWFKVYVYLFSCLYVYKEMIVCLAMA